MYDRLEQMEAKFKKDLVEKDKALDMLHAEVEKLESGKLKSRTSLGINLTHHTDKTETSGTADQTVIGNPNAEAMGCKIIALEVALKNAQKEKHRLRAQNTRQSWVKQFIFMQTRFLENDKMTK